MKKILLISQCVFLSVAPAAADDLSAADALAIMERAKSGSFSARAEAHALTFYLQGVVEGAAAYQQSLQARGETTLFCPPRGKGYSMQDVLDLLEKAPPGERDAAAPRVILEGFSRRFPCSD